MSSKMKVLHIAGGVSIQKLYQNIFAEFSKRKIIQDVYVPCNDQSKLNINQLNLPNLTYCYKVVGSLLDRILFYPKINKHLTEIEKVFTIDSYSCCFAYTVMTDGSLAYRLKKANGTPYSIFVRNTDINLFYKYLIWLRPLFKKILSEAEFINFPNPSYKARLQSAMGVKFVRKIEAKFRIVPNGIENFWHEHRRLVPKEKISDPIQLLFVGKIDDNKNVDSIIRALKLLNRHAKYELTIVGLVANGKKSILEKWQTELKGILHYEGEIKEKEALLHYYRNADIFVMPSLTETFGLVYIEALSQGLPIVYTEGEGVSGFFDDMEIGMAVINPKDEYEICNKILEISNNYNTFAKNTVSESSLFKWPEIIDLYIGQIDEHERI